MATAVSKIISMTNSYCLSLVWYQCIFQNFKAIPLLSPPLSPLSFIFLLCLSNFLEPQGFLPLPNFAMFYDFSNPPSSTSNSDTANPGRCTRSPHILCLEKIYSCFMSFLNFLAPLLPKSARTARRTSPSDESLKFIQPPTTCVQKKKSKCFLLTVAHYIFIKYYLELQLKRKTNYLFLHDSTGHVLD